MSWEKNDFLKLRQVILFFIFFLHKQLVLMMLLMQRKALFKKIQLQKLYLGCTLLRYFIFI